MAIVLFGVACGDDIPPSCPVEHFAGVFGEQPNHIPENCYAAQLFVARDSPTITPSQEDLDRYFERWSRVVVAEPILRGRQPQRYRRDSLSLFAGVWTTNPTVIAALEPADTHSNFPATGDSAFDQILSELVRPQLISKRLDGGLGGVPYFTIASSADLNEELLHTRLLATSSYLTEPYMAHTNDGIWIWLGLGPGTGADDATAQIDFTFGWGDCFAGCQGLHDLRAIVPPTGPAIVYDLGGHPLPDGLHLSPNTMPPP